MLVCPACGSSRIRNDYKPAPVLLRALGMRALLCDHCNHQFRAFSLRSPKSHVSRHSKQMADVFNHAPAVDLNKLNRHSPEANEESPRRISLNQFERISSPHPPVTGELVAPIERDLRTQITRLYEEGLKELPASNP